MRVGQIIEVGGAACYILSIRPLSYYRMNLLVVHGEITIFNCTLYRVGNVFEWDTDGTKTWNSLEEYKADKL